MALEAALGRAEMGNALRDDPQSRATTSRNVDATLPPPGLNTLECASTPSSHRRHARPRHATLTTVSHGRSRSNRRMVTVRAAQRRCPRGRRGGARARTPRHVTRPGRTAHLSRRHRSEPFPAPPPASPVRSTRRADPRIGPRHVTWTGFRHPQVRLDSTRAISNGRRTTRVVRIWSMPCPRSEPADQHATITAAHPVERLLVDQVRRSQV